MESKPVRELFYYRRYYSEFFQTLRPEVQRKFNWTLQLIATVEKVPKKYLEHLSGTNGLYEIRVEVGSDIFRVFCFFDAGALIILINGFHKKSQKTPRNQLERAGKLKNNISMKKNKPNLISFAAHLDSQYGKRGTAKREKYEQGFESFKLGVLLQEIRREKGMTQEDLAHKCGTTKTYISRIENDASDIRLSTLIRIVQQGLGGKLNLSVEM